MYINNGKIVGLFDNNGNKINDIEIDNEKIKINNEKFNIEYTFTDDKVIITSPFDCSFELNDFKNLINIISKVEKIKSVLNDVGNVKITINIDEPITPVLVDDKVSDVNDLLNMSEDELKEFYEDVTDCIYEYNEYTDTVECVKLYENSTGELVIENLSQKKTIVNVNINSGDNIFVLIKEKDNDELRYFVYQNPYDIELNPNETRIFEIVFVTSTDNSLDDVIRVTTRNQDNNILLDKEFSVRYLSF